MRKEVLNVENLSISFKVKKGKKKVVEDISFSLKEGESLGIVGESGSGKTMTGLAIMQLLDRNALIDSGKIKFKGQNLLKLSDEEMRKYRGKEISMIFQEPMTSLNPLFTVGNQIGEVIKEHKGYRGKKLRKEVIRILNLVEISDAERKIDYYPHQLSGGQQQRILIAIAIASNPKLLICDEPTTALDTTTQLEILKLINRLKKDLSTSVIFISHDLNVVRSISDNILIMYCGEILEKADSESIFASPKHPYTEALLDSIPQIGKDIDRLNLIEGDIPDNRNNIEGCIFYPRCKYSKDICRKEKIEFIELDSSLVKCLKYSNRYWM